MFLVEGSRSNENVPIMEELAGPSPLKSKRQGCFCISPSSRSPEVSHLGAQLARVGLSFMFRGPTEHFPSIQAKRKSVRRDVDLTNIDHLDFSLATLLAVLR
jgi:hypothetical protein